MGNVGSGFSQASLLSRQVWRIRLTVVSVATAFVLTLATGGMAIAAPAAGGPPSSPGGFTLLRTIPLPGPPGHGDWVAYDASNGYIYLSHHGTNVIVVDTKTNKVIANIDSPDLDTPDVITFDATYLYVTAEKAGKIVVISKANWKIVGTAATKGPSPDGIWLDAAMGRLYVVSNDANQLEVYGAGNQPNLIASYPLEPAKPKAGPDVGVLVPVKNKLYEPDDALVLAIDLDSGQVARRLDTRLPVTENGATKGMVFDSKGDHLWVATTGKQVLVLNPDTFAMVKTLPATEADDQMGFDPSLRLVYAFGGHGFDVYNADTMEHVAYVDTGSSVTHTGAVDPATHQVYVYEGQANVLGVYARR